MQNSAASNATGIDRLDWIRQNRTGAVWVIALMVLLPAVVILRWFAVLVPLVALLADIWFHVRFQTQAIQHLSNQLVQTTKAPKPDQDARPGDQTG